ncbi:MAG: universal stress protein [Saprospiraceae bacterium]|nr:universal stress protein [Saprospiraceae bacterium]
MKKVIIVGIDFSKGSEQALEYAIMIANHVTSNILMVWVGKGKISSSIYLPQASDARLEVKMRFEEIMEKYRDVMTGGKLMFKLRNGKVYKEIVNQAKYHDAFLIVAGTHGVSGFEEFWIGSNANKIVTYAPCPVITVGYKEDTEMRLKKIIVPIDSTRQTRQKVPMSCILAKKFNAELHIVSLYSTNVKTIRNIVDSYAEQVVKVADENGLKYISASVEADNVTNATIEYAKKVDGDLIAIMTEQETTTANILMGPYAQQMVNHSPIPVLSIHTKYYYDSQIDS